MRLTHINITNVLGLRAVSLAPTTPITLIAGPNGNGKTSLAESVRMALLGDAGARGVALKKDLPALVHAGAKRGQVEIHTDLGPCSITLPDGKAAALADAHPALPYVLDPGLFARLTDKERGTFLFSLTGLDTDPAAVAARLTQRGLDASRIERVKPMLRAGFDAACKHAKTAATEAKGAWRALTGETWGSVKGESWKPAVPAFDPAHAEAARGAMIDADARLEAAQQHIGRLQAQVDAAKARHQRIAVLQDLAGRAERIRAKLDRDTADLQGWNDRHDRANSGAANIQRCPCCEAFVSVAKDGTLSPASALAPLATTAEELAAIVRSRDLMASAVANGQRDLAAAMQAGQELAELTSQASAAVVEGEYQAARAQADDLKAERQRHASAVAAFDAAERAATQAEQTRTQALAHHRDVLAWDALADALGPDGIPAEMLAEALGPINARLAASALSAEWPRIEILADMSIQAALQQRPYRLLSESEKWRADAMLAEAISHLSGLRLLLLDRFDVLDLDGRSDLIDWLAHLAEAGELDTALVFGTLKSQPFDIPGVLTAHWIERGEIQQPQALKAAA